MDPHSTLTVTAKEYIVPESATSKIVSKQEVFFMTVEQFNNEKNYNACLRIVMEMLSAKVISEQDVKLSKDYLKKKYTPVIY